MGWTDGGANHERAHSTVVDKSGNIYIAGYYSGDAEFDPGPGTFQLTSIDNTFDIFVLKLGTSFPLDLGPDTAICFGDSILLQSGYSSSEYPHLWSTGSTDSFIYVKTEGIYSLRLTINGQERYGSMKLTLRPPPLVYVGPDTAFCGLFEYRIDAEGDKLKQYRWNTGDTLSYTIAEETGMYYVRVKDDFNCPNGDTMEIDALDPPQIDLISDTFLCNNATLQLEAGPPHLQYSWSTGATTAQISINDTGWYHVTVTQPFCSETDSIYVYEFCPPKPRIFIPNAFSPDENGLNDIFQPLTEGIARYHIEIYNRWGEKIFESTNPNIGWNGSYQDKACQQGVYMYKISYGGFQFQRHVSGTVMLLR